MFERFDEIYKNRHDYSREWKKDRQEDYRLFLYLSFSGKVFKVRKEKKF